MIVINEINDNEVIDADDNAGADDDWCLIMIDHDEMIDDDW